MSYHRGISHRAGFIRQTFTGKQLILEVEVLEAKIIKV